MKVEKREGGVERRLVTGMIVDSSFLGRVAVKWDKELFRSPWANLIGSWCVKYHTKYNEAPGRAIESLYESWAQRGRRDEATVKIVSKLLETLSEEYEALQSESNADYLTDLASTHFRSVAFKKLAESLNADLEADDLDKADERVNKFNRIELGLGAGIDVLQDTGAIKAAFEEKKEPLIVYKGALGNFFGDALERDGFISLMGPEKRGKTWCLLDLSWRAMRQRRRVAFFQVGDMSVNQMMRRYMIRAARRPWKAVTIKYPTFIEHNESDQFSTVTLEERDYPLALKPEKAIASCNSIIGRTKDPEDSFLRLSCHPSATLSVNGVVSILQTWERSDWIPDVIVIDYADLLAPLNSRLETRHQINETWMAMKALSQTRHCLVVTATQTDAASYRAHTVTRSNFSEDKRKFAHVTGMIGLSATNTEKDNGIMRFNWVQLRESEFTELQCVHVAGCLSIANPCILSTF